MFAVGFNSSVDYTSFLIMCLLLLNKGVVAVDFNYFAALKL